MQPQTATRLLSAFISAMAATFLLTAMLMSASQADEAPAAAREASPPASVVRPADANGAVALQGPASRAGGTADKALPSELSPLGMFMAADIVVKTVMVALAVASFLTWTVFFAKSVEFWSAKRRLREEIRRIEFARSLDAAADALAETKGAGAMIVTEAVKEVQRSKGLTAVKEGIKERVASRLSRAEAHASRHVSSGIGIVATVGSVAPFVGLFGTVWGIMNSFIGISKSQTTNLAVVAPGIAEALLATALGLIAAIPAVIVYNAFARQIAGYRHLLADASAGVERLVSFDLDASATAQPRIKAAE
jgi:biopolymer transport protein ExbB